MAGNRVGGTIYFTIDGTQYPARGKFEYSPLTSEKKNFAGQDGHVGYTEMPKVPFIKGDLTDLGSITVSGLQTLDVSTVTLELANGKTVILSNAWLEGEVSVSAEEGSYPVEFRGSAINELPSP
jgi:hypothetical protein